MSIRKFYRQINPIKESTVSLVEKVRELHEETLPTDFFDGFTHEVNTKAFFCKNCLYSAFY